MSIGNPIVAAQLNSFQGLFGLSGATESTLFEKYSIFVVLNGLQTFNVDFQKVHFPGDEFGIDGGCIIIEGEIVETKESIKNHKKIKNAELVFFQSKTSESHDVGDITKTLNAVQGIIEGNFPQPTTEIDDIIEIKDELLKSQNLYDNPKLTVYYCTTGKYQQADHVEFVIKNFRDHLDKLSIFSSISVKFIGASELQTGYRRATSTSNATFSFRDKITLPENPRVVQAHIGYIPAEELMKIVCVPDAVSGSPIINRRIFADNVREYDPDSDINLGIIQSIEEDGAGFVFRNNGVTIVAREGSLVGITVRMSDYQIVNGCQTCNIIYATQGKAKGAIDVPVRLIFTQDSDFINSIIIGTNKQNPVREEQFWALRPFLKDFEEYAKNQEEILYFERRENQFLFEDIQERTRIIDPAALLKSVVSMYLQLPNRAGRDYREIKREYTDTLFLPEHDVSLYYAAALAHYKLEFCYRNGRIDTNNKIFRMFILWSIARKFYNGTSLLAEKQNKRSSTSKEIIELIQNEPDFVNHAESCVHIIEETLSLNGLSRNRDSVKSDDAAAKIMTAVASKLGA